MKHFIYILTDNNRTNLHVGLTHDLNRTMSYYKEMHSLFFDSKKKTSRLVYFEEIQSLELASERFKVLSEFTRIQKEKLIRLNNTNWNDLSLQSTIRYGLKDGYVSYQELVFAS